MLSCFHSPFQTQSPRKLEGRVSARTAPSVDAVKLGRLRTILSPSYKVIDSCSVKVKFVVKPAMAGSNVMLEDKILPCE